MKELKAIKIRFQSSAWHDISALLILSDTKIAI